MTPLKRPTSKVAPIPAFISRERVVDAIEAPLRTDTTGPQVDSAVGDIHALVNRMRIQALAGSGRATPGEMRRKVREVLKLLRKLERFDYSSPERLIMSLMLPPPPRAIRTHTDPLTGVLAAVSGAIALLGGDIKRDGEQGGRPATAQRLREALRSIFVDHRLPVDTIVFDHVLDEAIDLIRAP